MCGLPPHGDILAVSGWVEPGNAQVHAQAEAIHAGPGGFADCRWLCWTEDTGLLFRDEGWMGEGVSLCMSVCERVHTHAHSVVCAPQSKYVHGPMCVLMCGREGRGGNFLFPLLGVDPLYRL